MDKPKSSSSLFKKIFGVPDYQRDRNDKRPLEDGTGAASNFTDFVNANTKRGTVGKPYMKAISQLEEHIGEPIFNAYSLNQLEVLKKRLSNNGDLHGFNVKTSHSTPGAAIGKLIEFYRKGGKQTDTKTRVHLQPDEIMLPEVSVRDSYERFFSEGYISKEKFFDFGIRETIYAPLDKAKEGWEELKHRIKNNGQVWMRGFGRNGKGSPLFKDFYAQALGNKNVTIDRTNNNKPGTVIRKMTGYSKRKSSNHKSSKHKPIRNYQVSHIFGRTKNIYLFTAPWNIVYLPKIIDPFTGHEAKGDLIDEYQTMFQQKSYVRFEALIEDYNQIISGTDFQQRVDAYFENISNSNSHSQDDIDKLIKSVREELSPIAVPGK
jgi:hypothetical protein